MGGKGRSLPTIGREQGIYIVDRLNHSERHFLELIYPEGTIAIGSRTGLALYMRGLVEIVAKYRYSITLDGIRALTGTRRVVYACARNRRDQ
jgi:hypothetical protein